jgi:mRNA interferase RelE/StbE
VRYRVILNRLSQKIFSRLEENYHKRIYQALLSLEENPWPENSTTLKGNYKENLLRIRVGDFRVIYSTDTEKMIVNIKRIDRRNEKTYKGL